MKRIGTDDNKKPMGDRPIRNPETRRVVIPGSKAWITFCKLVKKPREFKKMLVEEFGHGNKDAKAIVLQWKYNAGISSERPTDPELPVYKLPCTDKKKTTVTKKSTPAKKRKSAAPSRKKSTASHHRKAAVPRVRKF